ncbi:rhomboid family intramembrane serine protease [Nocardioides sp. J54]|uniref:rhomboid family intramembrane serine protease n=1 Tax=Nocardioides sp. J54 TaxID=935866 RepID=UPI000490A7CB|nr:rhomboid family intramembrane serine protease [Nocardioides sp. J54]
MSTPPVGVPTCYRHPDRETWVRCQRCERPICPDCMNDAAVGFQCPSCVAEGRKTQRQATGAYGGVVNRTPGRVTTVLLAVIAVAWVAITATGGEDSVLLNWLAMRTGGWCGIISDPGLGYPGIQSAATCTGIGDTRWYPGVADGGVWRLLTHVVTHVHVWHIAMNALALWQLGPQLERVFGWVRFLALYLLAGISGGVAVMWLSGGSAVGASGALFGLLAAHLVVARKVGADTSSLGSTLLLGVIISLLPGISWQGHLGGFIGGGVVAVVLAYAPRERRGLVQGVGLAAVALVLVGLTVLRMATYTA